MCRYKTELWVKKAGGTESFNFPTKSEKFFIKFRQTVEISDSENHVCSEFQLYSKIVQNGGFSATNFQTRKRFSGNFFTAQNLGAYTMQLYCCYCKRNASSTESSVKRHFQTYCKCGQLSRGLREACIYTVRHKKH